MKLYPNKCCVCFYYRKTGIKSKTLYKFPQREDLFDKWLEFSGCDRIEVKNRNPKICEDHFEANCFTLKSKIKTLNQNAVPTIKNISKSTEVSNLSILKSCGYLIMHQFYLCSNLFAMLNSMKQMLCWLVI